MTIWSATATAARARRVVTASLGSMWSSVRLPDRLRDRVLTDDETPVDRRLEPDRMVGDRDHRAHRAEHALRGLDCGLEVAEQVGEGGQYQVPQRVLGHIPAAEPMGEQLRPQRWFRGQGQETASHVSGRRDAEIGESTRRAPVVGHGDQGRDVPRVALDRFQGRRLAVTAPDCGDDRAIGVEEQRLESGRGLGSHRLMSRWRTAAVTSCSASRRTNSSAMATER